MIDLKKAVIDAVGVAALMMFFYHQSLKDKKTKKTSSGVWGRRPSLCSKDYIFAVLRWLGLVRPFWRWMAHLAGLFGGVFAFSLLKALLKRLRALYWVAYP
ncbi:hypothetical protein [Deinococcus sp. Marseille-Q6407]|uniref:hypothetical protein n=1 Tax=Deinococcus sp. Marseille-Q6407 TaxID=2969223 RepID=UPI0021C11752|nr:hypothetical protein [Deinococcus sp. Marseille-Q6407]